MRCRPSSRSFAEKRGVVPVARPSGDSGPGTFSLSRTPSANTQRSPVFDNALACRPMLLENSTIVVVPVRIASSAPMVVKSVASSPCSRLPGLHLDVGGIRKSEIFVEAALERGAEVRVAIDEPRHERLAAPVVDVGVRILLHDGVVLPDRDDAIALHGERHALLHGIGIDHHRVGEHNRASGRLLRLHSSAIDEKRGGPGSHAGQQFTTGDVGCRHGSDYGHPRWASSCGTF